MSTQPKAGTSKPASNVSAGTATTNPPTSTAGPANPATENAPASPDWESEKQLVSSLWKLQELEAKVSNIYIYICTMFLLVACRFSALLTHNPRSTNFELCCQTVFWHPCCQLWKLERVVIRAADLFPRDRRFCRSSLPSPLLPAWLKSKLSRLSGKAAK